jgi:cytochrome c oxidase assembly protein subunit 15
MASSDLISDPAPTPRWLHWWAVLTVVLALPLLTLGAEVTTKKVGMIDKAPVRSPLHLATVIAEEGGLSRVIEERGIGWLIEHSHRSVGWVVGLLAIGLAVGLGWLDRRRWMRWMGLAALVGVSSQGVLGMLRVELNERLGPTAGETLALVHGCTAQLVFALLVSVALWTSPAWYRLGLAVTADESRVRRAALVLVGLMFLQIVFGAMIRHKELALGTRLHILLAFGVVAAAVWLIATVLVTRSAGQNAMWVLGGLLAVQVLLGLETMLSKFNVAWGYTMERVEPTALAPDLVRSLHFLVGALTFSTAVCITLLAHRHVAWPVRVAVPQQLEGAL